MLEKLNEFVWGGPVLILLLGTGIYLCVYLNFPQFRLFLPACKQFSNQFISKNSTSFRSLCSALAAAVGTGNIAGVAGAIAIGGPGAVFWMWISGLIGMATKYAEVVLAVRYQRDGIGGAMWIIEDGLGKRYRPLAAAYSVFGLIASFGIGNAAQINAVMDAVRFSTAEYGYTITRFHLLVLLVGAAAAVWLSLRRGAARIMDIAELCIPFASVLYIILCLAVLLPRIRQIPQMMGMILLGAFDPAAVTGGIVGSASIAIRTGISRGTFSNEAGMGTSAAAHAGAKVEHPVEQGMMGIMEVFVDTIVICSLTAFVILNSGVPIPYGADCSSGLTSKALVGCCGVWSASLLTLCLGCFAYATILGWGLYAGRFLEYLIGNAHWKLIALCHSIAVVIGGMTDISTVWQWSELMNAWMAIPNVIALLLLSKEVRRVSQSFRLEK